MPRSKCDGIHWISWVYKSTRFLPVQEECSTFLNISLDFAYPRKHIAYMNKLSTEKRAQILHCIVEGNSLRATSRLTDTAINTVVNLMIEAGKACTMYQDKAMRNLKCRRLQCDEIWGFVGCKEKNVPEAQKNQGRGSVWTWTALDAETKLVPCWFIGSRDAERGIPLYARSGWTAGPAASS